LTSEYGNAGFLFAIRPNRIFIFNGIVFLTDARRFIVDLVHFADLKNRALFLCAEEATLMIRTLYCFSTYSVTAPLKEVARAN
jgi:hypothetical protein